MLGERRDGQVWGRAFVDAMIERSCFIARGWLIEQPIATTFGTTVKSGRFGRFLRLLLRQSTGGSNELNRK